MKNIVFIIFVLLVTLFVSCGSRNKKERINSNAIPKYITLIENSRGGYNTAYTEDGHTVIYRLDSVGNYVVYYTKYDANAGKYGYDRIKEKIVRVEMDSSLKKLNSFVAISGGVICKKENDNIYSVYYFDEKLNGYSLKQIETPSESTQIRKEDQENDIKRILPLLAVAHKIATTINDSNVSGWNNIVSALEPSLNLVDYDVLKSDTVYAPIIKEHITRVVNSTEGLTQYHNLLQEEQRRKHEAEALDSGNSK